MNRSKKCTLVVLSVVAVVLSATWVHGLANAAPTVRWAGTPLTALSGKTSASGEGLFVLDPTSETLLVIQWDTVTRKASPSGKRDLAADFKTEGGGKYTLIPVQRNNTSDLLYVIDQTTRRVLIYLVDGQKKTIVPVSNAIDLKGEFK